MREGDLQVGLETGAKRRAHRDDAKRNRFVRPLDKFG